MHIPFATLAGAIYPMRIEDALSRRLFTPGQFEVVTILLDRSSELAEGTIRAIESIASRGLIVATGEIVEVRATGQASAAANR